MKRQVYILKDRVNGTLDDVTAEELFLIEDNTANSGAVDSVNGQTGVVVLGSNQYNQNNITFKNVLGDYFGTITTPRTGTLTFDATDAVTGGISVVYYNNSTLDIPSVWLSVGDFIAGEINKLYFERDSEGYVTLNILNAGGDVTPPSTIGTLTITDE